MAEFRKPLHARIAGILGRMDARFLVKARCCFGGGTQISLAHGEYRESRDIDFMVSSLDGLRAIRETVTTHSLGKLFKAPILLAREVVMDRDALRTFIAEERGAQPIKFEIVHEGRMAIEGRMDADLGVPVLTPACAVAGKFLANADRGMDRTTHARDAIDLAFLSLDLDEKTFVAGFRLALVPYGKSVQDGFSAALRRLEIDAAFRNECIAALSIDDPKRLREGLVRLRSLKRKLTLPGQKHACAP